MTAEEVLQQFYNEYAEWLESGAESDRFWKTIGLCSNLNRTAPTLELALEAGYLLRTQLSEAGFIGLTPFNMKGRTYDEESFAHEMHLNKDRIKWVMEHRQ